MQKTILSSFLILFFLLNACGSESESPSMKLRKGARNPNGDSELALLMRDMEADCIRMRDQIQNGERPTTSVDVKRIKTAQATEPDKAASETFQTFADGYIDLVQALEDAPAETLESHYKGMVAACMGCHQALCPGPMVRIKKLF